MVCNNTERVINSWDDSEEEEEEAIFTALENWA